MESAPHNPESGPTNLRAAVRRSLHFLPGNRRRRYYLLTAAQMSTALLDLAGVVLFGVVALLAANTGTGAPLPPQATWLLSLVGIEPPVSYGFLAGLALLAFGFLMAKTLLSLALAWVTFRFLAGEQARASEEITRKFFAQPLLKLQSKPSQEAAYGMTTGVVLGVTVLLGSLSVLLSELALLLVVVVTLLLVDPLVTIVGVVYFSLFGVALQRGVGGVSSRAGAQIAQTTFGAMQSIQEGIMTFREGWIADRIPEVVEGVSSLVRQGARAHGVGMFVGQLPRATFDTAMVLGALGLATWQLATESLDVAIATTAVFLMAAARIAPSMQRLNAIAVQMRTTVKQAGALYDIADLAYDDSVPAGGRTDLCAEARANLLQDEPAVQFSEVSFVYPGTQEAGLHGVTFTIRGGELVAVVGPSGSGKSTLVDTLLGLLEPQEGSVRVWQRSPRDAKSSFPGIVGYVPQASALIQGTIRDNVALAVPTEEVDDGQVWKALEQAQLAEFVAELDGSLEAPVGERGHRLSGGQRQRLGIARAMYSNPSLLVLDEATSALDAETEVAISDAILGLGDSVTRIVVAHRLSTVRLADQVLYLDQGKLIASGSFDEVRHEVPDFERASALLAIPSGQA